MGTDVTSLMATFSSTGTIVTVEEVEQTSGVTVNDFSSPVAYVVIAQDGSTQTYTVTVTQAILDECSLTEFRFDGLETVGAIHVNGTDITITVPMGTDVTGLVATFSSPGTTVMVGGVEQTSGVTVNDFSNPVWNSPNFIDIFILP